MEGDSSKCISFDDNDNIVPVSGNIIITIPPLSKRTLTPIFRKRIHGLVLLPSNFNFKCLEYKEESKMKKNEQSMACDDRNNVIETKKEFPLSEKSPEEVTTESQQKETSSPSETAPSSSVGSSTPLKNKGTKNAGRIVLRCHDEKVLAWRLQVEKFREHLRNNRKKSTFGSLEEEQSISKEKVEKVVTPTETKPYSNSEELNSKINTEKIDGKEVEKISDPAVENIRDKNVPISRSSQSKVDAESPESEKVTEKIPTMLQPEGTSARSKLTAQCSDPPLSSNYCTSPTEETYDQPLDTTHERCFKEKLKKCHDLLREFQELNCEYESIRRANPVNRRIIMQREQISQMKKTRLNGETDYFKPRAEKLNDEKTSPSDPHLSSVESTSEILSESYVISENLCIGKNVTPKNVLESVEQLPDFYTYDNFKSYLLRRANRVKCESDRNVEDVDHNENFNDYHFLSEKMKKVIVLNSTFLGVR